MDFEEDWEDLRVSAFPEYVGERDKNGIGHVYIEQDGVRKELPPPDFDFDWGRPSLGSTYLAQVILEGILGPNKARQFQPLFRMVVLGLPENQGWRITRKDVLEALEGLL